MNTGYELEEAYAEWRGLAESEGEAIRTQNWSQLAVCQKALGHLQERITDLTQAVRAEAGPESPARELALRSIVGELIQLERRNQTLLDGAYRFPQGCVHGVNGEAP